MKNTITPILLALLFFLTKCGNENKPENIQNNTNKTSINQNTAKEKKDVKFTATAENIVEAGEIFQIKFEVNAEAESFNPPDFEGIDVISGPATSSFSSFQIINGKTSKKITNSYTYNISCPEAGTAIIKPAEVIVDGISYKTDTLKIKVIGEQNKPENTTKNKQQKINTKDDIFIHTQYNKTNVYNGEFIIATTKIYTRTDFQNISEIKFPDYSGFWTKNLKAPRQLKFHAEIINGKKYNAALLKQTLLFAVKPGKYTINPYVISLQIKKKDGKTRDFFGNIVDNYRLINKRLSTKKQTIVVKPLPLPAPDNFSGFTGKNVSVKAEIDNNVFTTDESANLTITVSGTGNLYLLTDFKIKLPEHLKHFKPETELKDKYTEYGETGDRIFKFIITADKEGNYKIPATAFVYFDSDKEKYQTIFTDPVEIKVKKGNKSITNTENNNTLSDKDIRYIKEKTELKKSNSEFIGSLTFYLLYPLLILIFTLIIYFRKKYLKANADIKAVRKKNAGKISQKRLKKAAKYMKTGNEKDFYKEILNVIWGYLKDKTAVNADLLTKENISDILANKNIDKETIGKLSEIIDECGYAQYSTSGETVNMNKIYDKTDEIINELEQKL